QGSSTTTRWATTPTVATGTAATPSEGTGSLATSEEPVSSCAQPAPIAVTSPTATETTGPSPTSMMASTALTPVPTTADSTKRGRAGRGVAFSSSVPARPAATAATRPVVPESTAVLWATIQQAAIAATNTPATVPVRDAVRSRRSVRAICWTNAANTPAAHTITIPEIGLMRSGASTVTRAPRTPVPATTTRVPPAEGSSSSPG